jgi:hypothetical protein
MTPPILPRSWTDPYHPSIVWTVYRLGRSHYVVQRWVYSNRQPVADPGPTTACRDVFEARNYVPSEAAVRLDRCPADDAMIVETWI